MITFKKSLKKVRYVCKESWRYVVLSCKNYKYVSISERKEISFRMPVSEITLMNYLFNKWVVITVEYVHP